MKKAMHLRFVRVQLQILNVPTIKTTGIRSYDVTEHVMISERGQHIQRAMTNSKLITSSSRGVRRGHDDQKKRCMYDAPNSAQCSAVSLLQPSPY